jgi:DNA topoisomerase 2-associated protein PAT1
LGKISFSNAKTPKPLLNFKRTDISNDPNRSHHAGRGPQPTFSAGDRKSVLHAIEQAYDILMQIEDHERYMPPPLTEGSDLALAQQHMDWKQKMQDLNQKLWSEIKIMEPIVPE